MDPLTALLVPGVLGGALVALWLARAPRHEASGVVPRRQRTMLLDSINMAQIKVAGAGGLGLMAGALVVAIYVPGVAFSIAAGGAAGIALAVGLILWRRRGPLPSSGQRPGASTTLGIEVAPADATRPAADETDRPSRLRARLRPA
jgi:hypothetical protein